MSNKNADSITEPTGTAATDKAAEQAFWAIPGASARVVYSLPLFHDIDFAVNEGYRKIPHGGIEVGALLFGSQDENGVTIDAFRGIECEHLFGPSFMLSDRDLNKLEAQIKNAVSDPDLRDMQLVGWFLAHTRGPLQLTDPELELFDRFFPLPGQLTLLVKPERFQPTLFGFLVRDASGNMGRDASQNAVILPLPGRVGRIEAGAGPQPSLMAPKNSRPPIGAPRPPVRPSISEPQPPEDPNNADAENLDSPQTAVNNPLPDSPSWTISAEESAMTADIRAARRRLKFEEARLLAEGEGERAADLSQSGGKIAESESGHFNGSSADSFPSALIPVKKKRPKRPEVDAGENLYHEFDDLVKRSPSAYPSRLMLVLPLAALIGSAAGYVAYLQIPSPVISLNARGVGPTVMVSWPPEETRKAVYAAIRIDDNAPVPLSPGEKIAGQLELSATPDMKIELITHNWLRDSRGIVRFVKAENLPSRTVPIE